MNQSRGLGRGLSALIPGVNTRPSDDKVENSIMEIPVSKIAPNKNQPRQNFEKEALNELADSIKEFGIIQPIIVRSLDRGGMYEIISGERRYRAAKMLDLSTVPCIVNHDVNDLNSLEIALIENIQRENLTPIELSHTFKQLIDELSLTHEDLSKRIGKSRAAITNSLRLLLLPVEIQKMVNDQKISAGHARALLAIEDKETQFMLANKIIENDLSVRETEKLVAKQNKLKEKSATQNSPGKNLKLMQFNKLPEVEKAVADFLSAPVSIKIGKNKGKIEILFGSVIDFERIVHKIIDS
ncbi:MAG: ParB/RepB/Spo0J family partition protein [Actinobacteria bacterium]|nr:ParB/RepB/Spo0J family partition protein [Actinomycetota bacterium]